MNKIRRIVVTFTIIGIVFGASQALAISQCPGSTTKISLDGNKKVDSDFVQSSGQYYKLSMACGGGSAYGTMSVLRGRPDTVKAFQWVMYPALKCAKGKTSSGKYNVYEYAKNHAQQYGSSNYSNQVSIRLYGNHCDDQKTGCYGSATATNVNS